MRLFSGHSGGPFMRFASVIAAAVLRSGACGASSGGRNSPPAPPISSVSFRRVRNHSGAGEHPCDALVRAASLEHFTRGDGALLHEREPLPHVLERAAGLEVERRY